LRRTGVNRKFCGLVLSIQRKTRCSRSKGGGGTSEHCSNRNTHSFCNGQVRSILFWCKYALFAHSEVFIINRWKLNSVIIEDSWPVFVRFTPYDWWWVACHVHTPVLRNSSCILSVVVLLLFYLWYWSGLIAAMSLLILVLVAILVASWHGAAAFSSGEWIGAPHLKSPGRENRSSLLW
jgi:hypothetical protein